MKKISSYRDSGSIDIVLIKCFENKLSVSFPESYKTLLSKYNSLQPVESIFRFWNPIDKIQDERDITFYGYGFDQRLSSESIESAQPDEYFHENAVVFGSSANGDYICFDYRDNSTTDEPKIVLMLHDFYDENNKMFICYVANNFEEFVNGLYKYEDDS